MVLVACVALVGCRSSAPPSGTRPSPSPSGTPASSPSPSVSPSPAPSPAQVPAGFGVLSTSWVSEGVGWALGVVPCSGGRCVSLVRTGDGGTTWVPVAAPPVPPATATDALAAQRVRFANLSDGWVFGPG